MDLGSLIVRRVIHPISELRDHPSAAGYRTEFAKTQFLPRKDVEALQLRRLRAILEHAYASCPFYRSRMEEAGIRPRDIDSFDSLRSLPPLTKKDIQDAREGLISSTFPESQRLRNQTGGSTGSPLQFFVDKERFDSRKASSERHDLWAGLRVGDWRALLWGARLDMLPQATFADRVRNEGLYRRVELNTSRIREEDWNLFISQVRSRKPKVLVAYAHSAALFGQYLVDQKIRDIKFKSIIPTAEMLMPEQSGFLEEVFCAKVFNRYGCREVSVIASECGYHSGMHICAETLLVEVVPDPSLPDGLGRILITDLLNRSMPLIRYEIGDVGKWATDQSCPCQRGLPLLAEVRGRTTDFIVLPDGCKISGPALTLVVADMPDVRQVQFVKLASGSVRLRVVPGNGYSDATKAELHKRLGLYLQGSALMEIEEVPSIASERSGKYRFVVNESDLDR